MKSSSIAEGNGKGKFIKCLIKGPLIGLSITLIGICIFAFALRFLNISVELIKPINQAIKIISILIGSFFALKGVKEMGLVTGCLIGLIYTVISFIVFSILNGGFSFQASLINDILFGGISGAIAGVVAVNVIKK